MLQFRAQRVVPRAGLLIKNNGMDKKRPVGKPKCKLRMPREKLPKTANKGSRKCDFFRGAADKLHPGSSSRAHRGSRS